MQEKFEIYIDGSCKPTNPGPTGCAAVLVINGKATEATGHFLGNGTNNTAELMAFDTALNLIAEHERIDKVNTIFTDSNYVVGLFSKNWKAKENKELVSRIKDKYSQYIHTSVIWVKAHAGLEWNELADKIAKESIDNMLKK